MTPHGWSCWDDGWSNLPKQHGRLPQHHNFPGLQSLLGHAVSAFKWSNQGQTMSNHLYCCTSDAIWGLPDTVHIKCFTQIGFWQHPIDATNSTQPLSSAIKSPHLLQIWDSSHVQTASACSCESSHAIRTGLHGCESRAPRYVGWQSAAPAAVCN